LLGRTSSKGIAADKSFPDTSVGQSKACASTGCELKFDL
jgi:hypothetical protein